MASHDLITPNGGTLVNRMVKGADADALRAEAASLPTITLSDKQACDLEMIYWRIQPSDGICRS